MTAKLVGCYIENLPRRKDPPTTPGQTERLLQVLPLSPPTAAPLNFTRDMRKEMSDTSDPRECLAGADDRFGLVRGFDVTLCHIAQ